MSSSHHKIGWLTACALVISNMVGTGVFTSLGFQLSGAENTWTIIILWLAGGVLALIGAFTFAELGTHYGDENGGDYIFISKGIHPFLGYLSALVSLVAGFAAPVAIAGIAMEAYLAPFQLPNLRILTIGIILIIGLIHSFSLKHSGWFQDWATIVKIAFILIILSVGIYFPAIPNNAFNFSDSYKNEIFTGNFATSLLYVTYSYTGWNAAAYIVGEIRKPEENLPKSLIVGTLVVTISYILLQLIFLRFASLEQLQGKADVAVISFSNLFGIHGSKWVSFGISVQLIATMSSYIWIGARVTSRMAKDYPLWNYFSATNIHHIPVRAIWLQIVIILLLLFSGTLEQVLVYTSFTLQLMGTLAVASLLFTTRQPSDFKSPLRPYIQILFIAFSCFVLGFITIDNPIPSAIGFGILMLLGSTYWFRLNGARSEK